MEKTPEQEVEDALFKRCVGYEAITTKPIKLKKILYSESGRKIAEEEYIEYTKEGKHVEANVSAIALYLKNRLPSRWGNIPEAEFTKIALEVLEE